MRDTLVAGWQDIGNRIAALAEAFPADRFDYRPAPDVRTFAEQLRHVAFWNEYTAAQLRGESPDGSANELPASEYATRDAIVGAVQRSFEEVRSLAAANGAAQKPEAVQSLVSMLEHNGEHYGQLVVYLRLNGIVPPASR